ncbi:class I SAM-dependent methyltransferase [Parvularcula sp. BGMRC 0090]|uniref:Class I SAM-dependent methyltransferase n=2 Tax=Parvularcula maris TaxID=2965077 RepID=A0A9X2LAH6_9PROT|nr:DUF938 domain-containing protein [Parvularcula maris]MCQ8185953.1 class I SAM-dependent methyltransferase [Parvularcula maris]
MSENAKIYSTSAARNKEIIAGAFLRLCPQAERVLELASGSGEHAEAVLMRKPSLSWQGSDPDAEARASTTVRMEEAGQPAPLTLDTREEAWWQEAGRPYDAVVAINMIHITAFAGVEGLFQGAARLLGEGGALFLYGPMSRRGALEESNQRFDESLKSRDPDWGVRDLDDTLQPLAARFALYLDHTERVPANNHVVVFRRS